MGAYQATDYRVIERVTQLNIAGNGYASFNTGVTVKDAVNEVVRCREAAHVVAFCGGAMVSGTPDEVLPILNALRSHAEVDGD